jgi:hypothetical protein
VAYIESGGVYLWAKYFLPNTLANAIIVKFNTLATKVVAVFDNSGALYYVSLDATTGSILTAYADLSLTFTSSSGALIIDSSDNIYMGMASLTLWQVVKFSMSGSAAWGYTSGLVGGQAYSVIFGDTNNVIYVGGLVYSVLNYNNVLTRLRNDGTMDWNYAWTAGLLSTNYYAMTSIYHATFSATNYIAGCSDGSGTYTKNTIYTKVTLAGTSTPSSSSYLDSSSSV